MPAAADPRIAARTFLQALGTVVDCVTAQRLFVQPGGYEPDVLYAVALGRTAEPVPLPAKAGGASGLYFDLRHQYVIVAETSRSGQPGWRVSTMAYEYRLLDNRLTELLVYHWQPNSVAGGPRFPHLHVSAELSARTSFEVRRPFLCLHATFQPAASQSRPSSAY